MKNKTINKFSLLIFTSALLILASCTEDFPLKLDSTFTRLVVDGQITTDTMAHKVILLKSGDALNKLPKQGISNAVVTITDGTEIYPLVEDTSNPGVYETQPDVYGVTGKTYTLNISNVDIDNDGILESYSASSLLKKINPVDSIQVLKQAYSSDQKGWLVNMFSRDIGGKSFYCIKIYKNKTLVSDSIKEYAVANNIGFEGKYYPGIPVYYLSNNKTDERVAVGDTVTLELDGITEEYFNFINGCITESRPKDPIFSGPSANVITNIFPNEKAAGFFTAYSVKRKATIYNGF